MNHLDEGTIHAWLDGALDARQAADVQSHVDACAACAANVAEARGLIAGSSRILNALDDVPAGVTPKKAATPPTPRRWMTSPWMTGIAAALVLVALWRTSDLDRSTPTAKVAMDSIRIPTLPEVKSFETSQPALAPVATAPQAQRATGTIALRGRGPVADTAAPLRSGAGAGGRVGAAVGETRQQLADAAASAAAAPAAPSPAPPVAAVAAEVSRDRAERSDAKLAKDAVDGSASWSGCYRLTVAARPRDEPVATANVARESRRVRSVAPTAGAAAPSAVTDQRGSLAAVAPSIVRLDTTAREPGFAVRSATRTDSTIGAWRELSADSARVELPSRGVFTVAKRDRVACPE